MWIVAWKFCFTLHGMWMSCRVVGEVEKHYCDFVTKNFGQHVLCCSEHTIKIWTDREEERTNRKRKSFCLKSLIQSCASLSDPTSIRKIVSTLWKEANVWVPLLIRLNGLHVEHWSIFLEFKDLVWWAMSGVLDSRIGCALNFGASRFHCQISEFAEISNISIGHGRYSHIPRVGWFKANAEDMHIQFQLLTAFGNSPNVEVLQD